MDSAIDLWSDPNAALDLANIRFQLIRLEDTITFHLIERVQFPLSKTIYTPGAIPGLQPTFAASSSATSSPDTASLSLLDWILREQERLQSLIRRYQSPDEYPFFPDALQTPILPAIKYPRVLHPNDVNVNAQLKSSYTNIILPAACAREDRIDAPENYGSAATCDVMALQALSRRIHFGKFVAEAKFRTETDRFVALIKANDRAGIDVAITDAAVEAKVLERLRLKANTYGKDPSGPAATAPVKVDADAVVAMYKDHVIPLTKVVEVEYLMQRLKGTEWE